MKQETSKKALLEEITQVGFAVDEMTLYLDTHPYETEAIDYLTYYVRRKNQLMKEYAYQYGPLTIVTADQRQDVWNWALMPMPWNGGDC
ncbi:MAG: spore coat protein CotJB [Firmicutes bacterium]|nr:spore coat protein CotJB [Bacillota bacterium]MDD6696008.1 spore coat protein CotJB [Bacillota bacterium]MDY3770848.1 spore coat protein CotJB [Lachnospiraceae bacterium]